MPTCAECGHTRRFHETYAGQRTVVYDDDGDYIRSDRDEVSDVIDRRCGKCGGTNME